MANVNAPFGLAPERTVGGTWGQQSTRYYIYSSDTDPYYIGDAVISAAQGDALGTPGIAKATGALTLRGVIVGFEPANQLQASLQGTTLQLEQTSIPATKTRDYYVYVVDDPMVMFSCQGDATATNQTAAKCNSNCSFTITAGSVAAPSVSYSQTVINSSTIATTSTLSGKLMGLLQIPNNTFGAYGVYQVKLNEHDLMGGQAGV